MSLFPYGNNKDFLIFAVNILDMPGQTLQMQIKLLLQEKFNQGTEKFDQGTFDTKTRIASRFVQILVIALDKWGSHI